MDARGYANLSFDDVAVSADALAELQPAILEWF